MTSDEELSKQAISWVKQNKETLIERFANPKKFKTDANPVAIFMAGSPGAGKTEFSIGLIEQFQQKPVRIDADEIRELIPVYNGTNAHLVQTAATVGVNKLYDFTIKHRLNVILDSTFSYAKAQENLKRAIKHSYVIEVYFVYQEPELAWHFTKIREELEGRKIRKQDFIYSYINSRGNVNEVKKTFGKSMKLNIVIKNYQNRLSSVKLNVGEIDPYLPKLYNEKELRRILS